MHTVAGLIELGDHQAAVRYALDVSGETAGLAEAIRERIEGPEIAALLLTKTTVVAERDVQLVLSEDSRLADTGADTNVLLTIVGNLIENAIDAAITGPHSARVDVRLIGGCDRNVTIEVADSGPGVPKELTSQIFTDGFTTKSGDERRHRGIGLALAHRLATRAGGTITVDCSGATTFTAVLPAAQQPDHTGAAHSGEASGRIEVGT
jgi:two-component system CitB family sensor kinase